MPNVGDTFLYNGAPTNGATVKLWPLSSFAVQPAQDTALPVGSPTYGPVVTAATSGGAGAWTVPAVAAGEYWASYEYAGHIAWAHLFVPAVMFPPQANQLTNGGFEFRQRPGPTFTTSGVYTLDMWLLTINGAATAIVSQITSTIGAGGRSLQLAYTHGASGIADITQKIENFAQLAGLVVTFAVTLKSTVNGTVRLYVTDGVGTTNSAYNVGAGSQRLVVSHTVAAVPTALTVALRCDVATCTVEANDATLVVGPTAMDYTPLPTAEDLHRCQRYYEVHGGQNPAMLQQGYGGAGVATGCYIAFKARKAVAPTMTKNGTWFVTNCGQPVVQFPEIDGYNLNAVVTALGAYLFYCNSSDDTITAEANI